MNQHVSKLSEKEIEDKVEEFQEWLRNEPHLPKSLGSIEKCHPINFLSMFRGLVSVFSFSSLIKIKSKFIAILTKPLSKI